MCYRGICTPGLNGLPCNSTRECFGTAICEESDRICSRFAPCSTSKHCLLYESCGQLGVCSAGIQSTPCKSNEECLPAHECRNSICMDLRLLERPSTTLNELVGCFVNVVLLHESELIELLSWLVGAVGFVVAFIVSQAPQYIMKPEDGQRRRNIFKVFLGGSIFLWVAYLVLAVIDQVAAHRIVSRGDDMVQGIGRCIRAESAIYEHIRQSEGQILRNLRAVAVGFFCQVIAVIVFTLAAVLLIRHYLQQEYRSQKFHVQWKKLIPIGLAVAALGLTCIFVGANIANERATLFNPYCEIVAASGNEYVTCALSIGNVSELLDEPFSEEVVNVCSNMTQQTIQTGSISSFTKEELLEEFDNLALQFTNSSEVVSDVWTYSFISEILAVTFFSSNYPNFVALRTAVAFIFLKVIFELILSLLLIRLVYKSRKVTVLTITTALLLVICELVFQILRSVYLSGLELQIHGINGQIVCGFLPPDSESNGVLVRSLSPGAGDILDAGTTFILVVIGFKELFAVYSTSNGAVGDQRRCVSNCTCIVQICNVQWKFGYNNKEQNPQHGP